MADSRNMPQGRFSSEKQPRDATRDNISAFVLRAGGDPIPCFIFSTFSPPRPDDCHYWKELPAQRPRHHRWKGG